MIKQFEEIESQTGSKELKAKGAFASAKLPSLQSSYTKIQGSIEDLKKENQALLEKSKNLEKKVSIILGKGSTNCLQSS